MLGCLLTLLLSLVCRPAVLAVAGLVLGHHLAVEAGLVLLRALVQRVHDADSGQKEYAEQGYQGGFDFSWVFVVVHHTSSASARSTSPSILASSVCTFSLNIPGSSSEQY